MENNRYRDFDSYFSEMKREPVSLKIFGETYELPPALPADIMLRTLALQKQHGSISRVPELEMLEMSFSIFGQERIEEWCKVYRLDSEQMGELIKWAIEVYTGKDSGNQKAPKGQK